MEVVFFCRKVGKAGLSCPYFIFSLKKYRIGNTRRFDMFYAWKSPSKSKTKLNNGDIYFEGFQGYHMESVLALQIHSYHGNKCS